MKSEGVEGVRAWASAMGELGELLRAPTAADPDARESVTSSLRAYWPPDVLLKFARARVIRHPRVKLYDELPPDVSPARPRE